MGSGTCKWRRSQRKPWPLWIYILWIQVVRYILIFFSSFKKCTKSYKNQQPEQLVHVTLVTMSLKSLPAPKGGRRDCVYTGLYPPRWKKGVESHTLRLYMFKNILFLFILICVSLLGKGLSFPLYISRCSGSMSSRSHHTIITNWLWYQIAAHSKLILFEMNWIVWNYELRLCPTWSWQNTRVAGKRVIYAELAPFHWI